MATAPTGTDRFLAQGTGSTSGNSTATLVAVACQAAERVVLATGWAIGSGGEFEKVVGFGAVNPSSGELEFSCEAGSDLAIVCDPNSNNELSLQITGPAESTSWRGLLRLELQVL